jgi:hypothetical protein
MILLVYQLNYMSDLLKCYLCCHCQGVDNVLDVPLFWIENSQHLGVFICTFRNRAQISDVINASISFLLKGNHIVF